MNHAKRGPSWSSPGGRGSALAALAVFAVLATLAAVWSSGCNNEPSDRFSSKNSTRKEKGNTTRSKTPAADPAKDDSQNQSTETVTGPRKFKERYSGGPKEALAVPGELTRQLHEPLVAMTEAHAKTCVVKVGDPFPECKLTEVGGSEEELSQHRGEKLTVVVFWNTKKLYAAEQFAQLKSEVSDAYSKFGVGTVAINVGDPPEVVAKLARQYEIDFPCLLDPEGAAYKQVATDKLPRTYLLDAQGKILWFDLEYSSTMRYELNNAVFYYLK